MINYIKIIPTEEEIEELILLSKNWEEENITYGYRENTKEDIIDKMVFIAKEDNKIIGYIFAKEGISKNYRSVIPDDEAYFGIEEIYVIKDKRSFGVGKALIDFAKSFAKDKGYKYIMLSTSTKDWNKILDFYVNKCDMTFYCASLVEKI